MVDDVSKKELSWNSVSALFKDNFGSAGEVHIAIPNLADSEPHDGDGVLARITMVVSTDDALPRFDPHVLGYGTYRFDLTLSTDEATRLLASLKENIE